MAKGKGKRRTPPTKWKRGRRSAARGPSWNRRRATRRSKGIPRFRRTRSAVTATVAAGKWVNGKRTARRDARRGRLSDRISVSVPSDPDTTTIGNTRRSDRDPLRTSAFMERQRHRERWWSRNIHYAEDGSITTTPTPAYTRHGRMAARAFDGVRDNFIRAAERRADQDRRLGRPTDRGERAERRAVVRRERGRRLPHVRAALVCSNCAPPLNRFKTVAELNRHFRDKHMDDGKHGRAPGEGAPRGMPNRPRGRHRAPDPRTTRTSTPSAPRRRLFVVGGRRDQARQQQMEEAVMATGTFNEVQQWGEVIPDGTGGMREDLAGLGVMGDALAEAIETKVSNYASGAGALNGRPIEESVLNVMRQALEAAEKLKEVGPKAVAAFDEEYGKDIERAKAQDRPEEEWLSRGA